MDHLTPVPVNDCYLSLRSRAVWVNTYGSAVIVREGLAVTNRHILDNARNVQAFAAHGTPFTVKHVFLSDRLDLAVFEIPCGIGTPVKIGERAGEGDRIFSAGTAFGSPILEGTVVSADFGLHHVDIELPSADQRDKKGRPITRGFVYEGDFRKGFSGGPIVNSKGELVGINQGRVLRFLSDDHEKASNPDKTYGLGYHLRDVLEEIKHIAPETSNRCK